MVHVVRNAVGALEIDPGGIHAYLLCELGDGGRVKSRREEADL